MADIFAEPQARFQLMLGDCLEKLKELPDNSIDSIVTDPPYGLSKVPDVMAMLPDWFQHGYHERKGKGFMGKEWDVSVPQPIVWRECLRVLKPGGHLLSFGGTRTYDLMVMSLRIAGFEIRDQIAWIYGQGFPKGSNISKAMKKKHLDKQADKWEGWNTALKPALEPIVMARKPISESAIFKNVLKWGTGAINIDESRVSTEGRKLTVPDARHDPPVTSFGKGLNTSKDAGITTKGRYPSNLIHDGSDEVEEVFPHTKSGHSDGHMGKGEYTGNVFGQYKDSFIDPETIYADSGSASRFFYCSKTTRGDRNDGLEKPTDTTNPNNHPTVKPTDLMQYLVRLVTPPDGIVLDPFMGSGSTGKACMLTGFRFVGIEMQEDYYEIAGKRIHHARKSNKKE